MNATHAPTQNQKNKKKVGIYAKSLVRWMPPMLQRKTKKVKKKLVFKQIDLSFLVMEGVKCEGDQVFRPIKLSFPMACLEIKAACSHCNVIDTVYL